MACTVAIKKSSSRKWTLAIVYACSSYQPYIQAVCRKWTDTHVIFLPRRRRQRVPSLYFSTIIMRGLFSVEKGALVIFFHPRIRTWLRQRRTLVQWKETGKRVFFGMKNEQWMKSDRYAERSLEVGRERKWEWRRDKGLEEVNKFSRTERRERKNRWSFFGVNGRLLYKYLEGSLLAKKLLLGDSLLSGSPTCRAKRILFTVMFTSPKLQTKEDSSKEAQTMTFLFQS